MNIELKRVNRTDGYTEGRLFIDSKYFCDTLEPAERPAGQKVAGRTAIPYGIYSVTIDIISPKYSRKEAYVPIEARMPRLLDVPGFEGILIHPGNSADDTAGCILVGQCASPGRLSNSRVMFFELYERLKKARTLNDPITLTIVGGA